MAMIIRRKYGLMYGDNVLMSVSKPQTTPECKRLMEMVIEGLKANIFEAGKKESARVALKRLHKKRCTKALEYIMQVSCDSNPLDTFAREVCNTATEYLRELS